MATAAAPASTRNREPHYITIRDNNKVELQLVKSSYSSGLLTALGISASAGDADKIVGSGRDAAFENGAVPVVLVYKATSGKNQTARVLCSPSKADTIFSDGIGKTYRGRPITSVRFPRRRVYVY